MTEEWYCEKLTNLKIKESRLSTLTEIHEYLKNSPDLESKVTERLLTCPEIYNCLDEDNDGSNNAKPLDLVTDILTMCMEKLSLEQGNLPSLLNRALKHKQIRIRNIALNTIYIELSNKKARKEMIDRECISRSLLNHIFLAVQEEDPRTGSIAFSILCLILEPLLEEREVKAALLDSLKKSDIVKCRIYELGVELARQSESTLQNVEFILDHALSEFDNDDVLLQHNILQILIALAERNHGLLYLEKRQVFEVLERRIEEMDRNSIDHLLIGGIMKFFGKICSVQPQKIIDGYPHMIKCLFECFDFYSNITLLPIAFDTLANLMQTQQAVLLLEKKYDREMMDVFEKYLDILRTLPADLKIRAFNSLEHIFMFPDDVQPRVSSILQRWFTYLSNGTNNMQFLMDFCSNPFPDLKISALNFVSALCIYSWGIEALKNTAGFLEFLLDRKIEFDKDVKYAKFYIVKVLANSNTFDVQTTLQLQTFVNEGPYFVQPVMDVAVEGNE